MFVVLIQGTDRTIAAAVLATPAPSRRKVRAQESAAPGSTRVYRSTAFASRTGATDSATESKPPAREWDMKGTGGMRAFPQADHIRQTWRARVKGWGKSPPRLRQRWRHGKPRCEQGRAAEGAPPASKTQGLRRSPRVGCLSARETERRDG